MSDDLSKLLKEWPYEPGHLSVRMTQGDDGRPKIQLRVDLGVLQMEVEGRPDGQRPEGFESHLELQEALLDEHLREGGDPSALTLSPEVCRVLREEATQYYHRYVALFVLEDFEGVVRDTSRNLRLLDFFREHAADEEDRTTADQFRPYILMMRTRALATQAVRDSEPKAAMVAIDNGLASIREHFEQTGAPEEFEQSKEVELLRGMRDGLVPKLPKSAGAELRDRLKQALAQENYELAAILRDELKSMKD
jgi:hypothetical protein